MDARQARDLADRLELIEQQVPGDWDYLIGKDKYVGLICGIEIVLSTHSMPHQNGWQAVTSGRVMEADSLLTLLATVRRDLVETLSVTLDSLVEAGLQNGESSDEAE